MNRYFLESFDDDELRRFGEELEIAEKCVILKEKVSVYFCSE